MPIDPDSRAAVVALNRFGLGAKPGDLATAAADPRGFLLQETREAGAALLQRADLPSSSAAVQTLFADQQRKRMERERSVSQDAARAEVEPEASSPMTAPLPASGNRPPGEGGKSKSSEPTIEQTLFRAEAMARFQAQAGVRAGFVERLVAFWSNHFAVSVAKGPFVRVAAGPFEREAIRPHVLGKFSDMLKAVESHPAMLFYLDNQRSIGPESPAGRFGGRGLNENLAREILELHTLGAEGGYTQADVTALARVITGWSFADPESPIGEPGGFVFKANWHEPGAQRLLGKTYAAQGQAQGEAALDDIARHPSTATHVATKLVRHFVADEPPPPLVAKLAETFKDTDGDLKAVSNALVEDDLAWRAPFAKIRTPNEFVIAAARATGLLPGEPGPILGMLDAMGMPLWRPAGPNGFPDTSAAWASPESMKLRLDASWQIAQRAKDADPLGLIDTVSGSSASPETREAISRAESREQALAILFMSPEFLRR